MVNPAAVAQVFQQAIALHQAGKLDEARRLYETILEGNPQHADVLHLAGILSAQQSKFAQSIVYLDRALKCRPSWPDAWSNKGNALREMRRLEEATAAYRKALAAQPTHVGALYNLATTLVELNRHEEAIPSVRRVLGVHPEDAEARNLLGTVLSHIGRHDEAIEHLTAAVRINPGFRDAHNNLGIARSAKSQYEDAVACYRRALEIDPGFERALNNLGMALANLNRHEESEQVLRRALAIRPVYAEAEQNLGITLTGLGRYTEAVGHFRRSLQVNPGLVDAHTHLIFTLGFTPDVTFENHAEECARWNERFGKPLLKASALRSISREPERKLKVGYVSADFKRHSAASAFGPAIRFHDRSQFEVFLYSGVTKEDDVTAEFRRAAGHWRATLGWSDETLAQKINEDQVDILVDLAAFTAGNRLLVFARKPAPIQVSAWGYAVSTGLSAIDYHFSDPVAVPEDARQHYTECVVDLPCCVGFEPPAAPDEGPVPSLGGPITYGSLNRLVKMSATAIELWSRVLREMPGSRLLIKDVTLSDAATRDRITALYASQGIERERLVLLPGTSQFEHLGAYRQVDVVLDPAPHTGGVSTLEALWMGVPVVTLAGKSFPGRISASILSALGEPGWIATNEDEYVRIALHLASDVERRVTLRQTLRRSVQNSSLCGERYCRAVETAYRQMWVKYCQGP